MSISDELKDFTAEPRDHVIDRRRFLLTTLAGALAPPLAAEAQPPARIPRVAIVYSTCIRPGMSDVLVRHELLQDALREQGYFAGQNVNSSVLCADEDSMLSTVIADEVRVGAALIVALDTRAARAASGVTKSVPIVMIAGIDPVPIGLVGSLAHPGGNVTGVALMASELAAKRLELLKELVPRMSSVGVLGNPDSPTSLRELVVIRAAASALGLRPISVDVRTAADFERALVTLANARVAGFIVATDPVVYAHAGRIAQFALKTRLPSVYGLRDFVAAGGLMSYEPSAVESARQAARYVERILKGTKPTDLPVEQPTKFELVINLKTAKALGLTLPSSLRLRADEVIQ